MPEGHTIHRLARDIRRDLGGRPVRARAEQERFAAGAARLDGVVLEDTEAYGKHLFGHFASGDLLHVHLGLVGTFVRVDAAAEPSEALRLRLGNGSVAWDLTGAMTCRLGDPTLRDEVVAGLGPDPLRRGTSPAPFVDAITASRRQLAVLLLDQSVVAGIGNVYRSEVLFLHGLHPTVPGSGLDPGEAEAVWGSLRALLRIGVRRNRIITRPLDELPRHFDRSEAVYVYKRAGDPCRRCGTAIEQGEVGGRLAWWCPRCQPR